MPKLIAILEHDSARIELLNACLDDRVGMYGQFIGADPKQLIGLEQIHGTKMSWFSASVAIHSSLPAKTSRAEQR